MESLHSSLEKVYAELVTLRAEFGDPRLHTLLFKKAYSNPNTPNDYIFLQPLLSKTPPPQLIGLETAFGRSHYISQQDLLFRVPRANITRAQLSGELTVDAVKQGSVYTQGTSARVVYVDESKPLYFSIVVSINKDSRPGERT